jgi:tetratricopeptide (TPR) repeat protein
MKNALCAAALVCAAIVAVHAAGQAPAADPLESMEKALQAQPDDLKAGNDYRMAIVKVNQLKVYDRAIAFFDKLVAANSSAANAHLNYGFAYVDKIPAAGSITQVILANNALGEFTKALELKPTWIGYYTRGNSYLFWPRIFGRTSLGVADLQQAMKIQKDGPKHFYYARVYVALGDGYWKMDNTDEATKTWRAGLAEFPDDGALKARLAAQVDALKSIMDDTYDPAKRVDTNLKDLWSNQ